MSNVIESVHIQGFRSLADVRIARMPRCAVMIGPNGSGKSNFIRFFEMLSWMLRSRSLGEFVQRQGGADDQLFQGNNITPRLQANLSIKTDVGLNEYSFALAYAHPDRFFFTEEKFRFSRLGRGTLADWHRFEGGHSEARIVEVAQSGDRSNTHQQTASVVTQLMRNVAPYQFHDTSQGSNFKKTWEVGDNRQLRTDGGNLPAILLRLEQTDLHRYESICRHISRILPGFDRFDLDEDYRKVALRWKARASDKTFGAHLTSDGSLRFFALVTLLNLPDNMLPDVILLDEPELGLHPAAIKLIGGMIRVLSGQKQVLVATESPLLVDAFDLAELIVFELEDGQTRARVLDQDEYRAWLDDGFSPGELWQKNVLGGRP